MNRSNSSPKVAIKIYGERNSGTNFLEKLLENNLQIDILKYKPNPLDTFFLRKINSELIEDFGHFKDRSRSLGWKHGCPQLKAVKNYCHQRLLILTITKNPYTFLQSLYKRPYHTKMLNQLSFNDFLHQDWVLTFRDHWHKKVLTTPIDLWNIKNRSYLELQSKTHQQVINIRYEDLLRSPRHTIESISKVAEIPFISEGTFTPVMKSTKNNALSFNDYQTYYLHDKWLKKLQAREITWINRHLDKEVCQSFGYALIDNPI